MPPLQASDSDDDLDLERSRVSSDIMKSGAEDKVLKKGSDEDSVAMNASDDPGAKIKGNNIAMAKSGTASFASTARAGRQTRAVNGGKLKASIVALADVEDDGQESDDEKSCDDGEFPALPKSIIEPGARRGRSTRTTGFGTNDNAASARPAHVPKKRGRPPKVSKTGIKDEDEGPSEQPAAKRRGRPAATPSATNSSPASRIVSRGRGPHNASRKLVATNETGQRRSARAAAAASEAQVKAAVKYKAKKSRATTATIKPTLGGDGKLAANKRGEYNVEAITDHRLDKNASPEYLVQWEGYPASQNTWEPKRNLTGCKAALDDYLKKAAKA